MGRGEKTRCLEGKEPIIFEKDVVQNLARRGIDSQNYNHKQFLLERVLDSLTHPFYVIDVDTYQIILANKSAENSFQKRGATCYSSTHGRETPCNSADHQCPLDVVIRTGQPVMVEHIHLDANGHAMHMEVHGYPIFDEAGRVKQMIEYNLNVTDRKLAKKALETANQKALLYMDILGHDISNQLQIISFCIEFLQSFQVPSTFGAHFRHLMDLIDESSQKCMEIISKVKLSEKLMTAPLVERRLDVILESSVNLFIQKQKCIKIDIKIEASDCMIHADEFLELVFSNLLKNAYLHNPDKNKRIWITLQKNNSGFLICIEDNGPGIHDSLKLGLFDMTRRYGGIGLHQSNHIVQKYGGFMKVYDRLSGRSDSGTRFSIWLPEIQRSKEFI